MAILADMGLSPGGVVAWVVVGLLAGWLAGKVVGGTGFGVILDIVLGLAGALVGGVLFGLLVRSDTGGVGDIGFWGSVVVAFFGACLLLAGVRALGLARRA
jgi:uncharacterized membrane protein YeaQ/YmgE (transglycosylase-associated protein family)